MMSKGAYSKKHQYLEKERVRQLQDHVKKADRERVQRLSKQTAQRQRALEEKKLAMAAAEEERRKKALEDRRRAQKEATDRFKSAFSRIKSTSKGPSTNMRNKQLNIEYYLPNKQATKFKPSNQKLQTSSGSTGGSGGVGERVAIGKEVEVSHHRQVGLQKRTPSLDDVLNQLRGEHQASRSHHGPIQEQGQIIVHKGYYTQQTANRRIVGPGALLKGRSASDSSLNTSRGQPPVESHQLESDDVPRQPVEQTDVSSMELRREANSIVVTNASDENLVFHPVVNKSFQAPIPRTHPQEELRITSPDLPDSSSSSSELSNRSSSPPLEDSLDSNSGQESVHSATKAVKLRTKHRQHHVTHSNIPPTTHSGSHGHHGVEVTPGAVKGAQVHAHTHSSSQPVYACEESDSSSSSDSPRHHYHLPPRPTPPRSRRQARQPPQHTNTDRSKNYSVIPSASTGYAIATVVSSASHDSQISHSPREGISRPDIESLNSTNTPKIVGILKKSNSQSSSKASSAVTTACSSRLTSAATSMLMEGGQTKHTQDGNGSTISDNASTKSLKRVRFKDQAESEKKPTTIHDDFIDSARIELWKKVLPNGFSTHFLPNSAFTPKMKVSLSPKQVVVPSGISGPPRKPNGITVHVPAVPVESSPSPPNMKHTKPRSENGGKVEESECREDIKSDTVPSTLKEKYERSQNNSDENQLKMSPPINVESSLNNSTSDDRNTDQVDQLPASTTKTRALDKTPTDDDINDMWDEIRSTLHENKKVSISPQVFNFRVPIEEPPHPYVQYGNRGSGESSNYTVKDDPHSHTHVQAPPSNSKLITARKHIYNGQMKQSSSNAVTTASTTQKQGGSANSGRQLVHRQNRARTMRCANELHSPAQMWNRHNHNHAATYPHTHQEQATQLKVRSQHPNAVPREPEMMMRVNSGSSMRNAPTALSLEEQRLMQSIEKLDQRIKDHLGRPQNAPVRMSHVSPEPPDFTPEYYPHPPLSSMPPHPHPARGANNLIPKKSRVHRNTTKTVQNGRLMNNSTRAQYRHVHSSAHRQVLYNK